MITGVDKLLTLVNEREEITLSEAARELNVPRHIVEQWTNVLEAKDLLSTSFTIKERYLMSVDFQKYKSSAFKSMVRYVKSIGSSRPPQSEDILKKKELEINKRMSILNDKIKECKRYERIKSEAILAMKKLQRMKTDMTKIRNDIEMERSKLDRDKLAFEKEVSEFKFAIGGVTQRIRDYASHTASTLQNEITLSKSMRDYHRRGRGQSSNRESRLILDIQSQDSSIDKYPDELEEIQVIKLE